MIRQIPYQSGSFNGIFASLREHSYLFHVIANNLLPNQGGCTTATYKSGKGHFVADGDLTTALFSEDGTNSEILFVFPSHVISINGATIARPGACAFPRSIEIEGLTNNETWENIASLNNIELSVNGEQSFNFPSSKYYQQVRLRQTSASHDGLFYLREVEFFGTYSEISKTNNAKSKLYMIATIINIIN